MFTLRIEHHVADFDDWKRNFDADPLGRERSGVLSYRVTRPVEDRGLALVDLDFGSRADAEAMLAALRGLWGSVAGLFVDLPQVRITEVVEERELRHAKAA